MPYLHSYRIFISHAWRYSEGYQRAIEFLNDASNFNWINYSIPSDKKFESMGVRALEEELRGQIRPVQCVIVLAGMYANHSDWIQFEIDFAKSLGKPILGIVPWGAERTPLSVTLAANKMVNWSSSSIVAGIREITP
ncbi:TIR domain-containing protein [Xanthomonas campestris]|uniref:TIR domain-containing protein n=1 Tax=Xanthomonas campestris pv. papavericola TaxID=487881 RepID=A0AAJ3CD30_XANCA|nr:TIR domain-containing protein [Xanthomonas campestris]MEC3887416.1 TIR domain-containing protein [Xanthomonas campestris pv. papavericola]